MDFASRTMKRECRNDTLWGGEGQHLLRMNHAGAINKTNRRLPPPPPRSSEVKLPGYFGHYTHLFISSVKVELDWI